MNNEPSHGGCLCGAVTYTITDTRGIFQYCHCSRCRKFTGSAFGANILVAPEHFSWTSGEELVRHFALPGAKHFATSFCSHCGSSLPWLAQSGKSVVVPAGTLDDDPGIRPIQNIFCDSDAVWYTEPHELPAYQQLPPRKA